MPTLPEKDFFNYLDSHVVDKRRKALEEYMTRIVQRLPTVSYTLRLRIRLLINLSQYNISIFWLILKSKHFDHWSAYFHPWSLFLLLLVCSKWLILFHMLCAVSFSPHLSFFLVHGRCTYQPLPSIRVLHSYLRSISSIEWLKMRRCYNNEMKQLNCKLLQTRGV